MGFLLLFGILLLLLLSSALPYFSEEDGDGVMFIQGGSGGNTDSSELRGDVKIPSL